MRQFVKRRRGEERSLLQVVISEEITERENYEKKITPKSLCDLFGRLLLEHCPGV